MIESLGLSQENGASASLVALEPSIRSKVFFGG